jgi:hypothetical protein
MIQDISPQHRARIESFQPFNGTDKAWAPFALRDLQVLSNTDKHRVINTTVARTVRHREMMHGERVVIVRDATSFRDEAWFEGGPIDGAEIVRVVLEGVGPGPKVTVEGLIAVTVCFDDPALMRPHPNVVSLLRAIYKSVGEVVAAFEPDL